MSWEDKLKNEVRKYEMLEKITVGQLITILNKFDRDMLVGLDDGSKSEALHVLDIMEGKIVGNRGGTGYEFVQLVDGKPNPYDKREVPHDAKSVLVIGSP